MWVVYKKADQKIVGLTAECARDQDKQVALEEIIKGSIESGELGEYDAIQVTDRKKARDYMAAFPRKLVIAGTAKAPKLAIRDPKVFSLFVTTDAPDKHPVDDTPEIPADGKSSALIRIQKMDERSRPQRGAKDNDQLYLRTDYGILRDADGNEDISSVTLDKGEAKIRLFSESVKRVATVQIMSVNPDLRGGIVRIEFTQHNQPYSPPVLKPISPGKKRKSRDARDANTADLQRVATRMGSLTEQVVFLGGAILPFLFTQQVPLPIRRAKDVDLLFDFDSDQEMDEFEDALWEHGFKKKRTGAVCRWVIEGVGVDVLPVSPVLGLDQRWLAGAVRDARQVHIGNGQIINIIPSLYFLGVKLAAFHRRAKHDYAKSYDIYDILLVLAGRPEIENEVLKQASPELRAYLGSELAKILDKRKDLGPLVSHYARGNQAIGQLLPQVISRMERIVAASSRQS